MIGKLTASMPPRTPPIRTLKELSAVDIGSDVVVSGPSVVPSPLPVVAITLIEDIITTANKLIESISLYNSQTLDQKILYRQARGLV